MMAFIQAVPQAAQVSGDLIARAMDWPGADDIAERLEKMLPPGMLDEELTPEQQQAMRGQAEAQQQAAQQAYQLELADKQADIGKKQASAEKDMAAAQKYQVEAMREMHTPL